MTQDTSPPLLQSMGVYPTSKPYIGNYWVHRPLSFSPHMAHYRAAFSDNDRHHPPIMHWPRTG